MIVINDLLDNRYKIKSNLGHGGMSDVYEARDIIFKRPVAIKMINKSSFENKENLIRFENEARISASLNHPNIVKIYDYGMHEGYPYIVNEFQRGQTLKDALSFKRYFNLQEACSIVIQILDALSYMHSKRIVHRDIKPQNIFYGSDGIAKISDFGISVSMDKKLKDVDENNKVVGTAQYLAPEVIRGHKANAQSDIYSMGVTFFELVTGYLPFDDENVNKVAMDHVKNEFPSPLEYMPNLPKEFEEIIKKSTTNDISIRYKSALEMKEDVLLLYQNKKKVNKNVTFFERVFGIKM